MIFFPETAGSTDGWTPIIRFQEIKGLYRAESLLPRSCPAPIVFESEFFAHFIGRNVITRSFITNTLSRLFRRNLDLLSLGDAVQNEVGFRLDACGQPPAPSTSCFLFLTFRQARHNAG